MELINKICGILFSSHFSLSTFNISYSLQRTFQEVFQRTDMRTFFHTKNMRNDTYLRIICPLFSRRPHIVSFDMNDICCCYKTESLKSTPEALERWDRVKIPRCAVHLQMLSTECNLASSRARRLSVVLVFKIVLTSSKTSSAGHKFCSP